MMGWKIKLKGGAEYDLTSRWRKWGIYVFKPGMAKYWKNRINRRARREAKDDLKGKY